MLYYNTVVLSEITKLNDKAFLKNGSIFHVTKQSFINKFWISERIILPTITTATSSKHRPNQIIAQHCLTQCDDNQKVDVTDCIKHKLLTKRITNPADERYKPYFTGSFRSRTGISSGTVHPVTEFYQKLLCRCMAKMLCLNYRNFLQFRRI